MLDELKTLIEQINKNPEQYINAPWLTKKLLTLVYTYRVHGAEAAEADLAALFPGADNLAGAVERYRRQEGLSAPSESQRTDARTPSSRAYQLTL